MNIWGPNGNRVATYPPGPDDVFCVTTLFGQRVFLETVADYAEALDRANYFCHQVKQTHPVTVRVMCLSMVEARAMGYVAAHTPADQTPEQDAEDRQFAISTLWRLVRDSNDAKVRADALHLLRELGEVR